MKKISVLLLVFFSLFSVYCAEAEPVGVSEPQDEKKSVYKLTVNNCDDMALNGSLIKLSGNVDLGFETSGGKSDDTYTLTCQRAVLDTDTKTLSAMGNVRLNKKNDSKGFVGNVLTLNWEKIDIKVFEGVTSSERNKSSSTPVTFYANGESISYAGEGGTVYFEDGTIATSDIKDPYWSIDARQLALMENDIFVESAVFKIGRVPVLWLPAFFYPGAKLGFNPAVGASSTKGAFINTTTEVYGVYPVSETSSDTSAAGMSAANSMLGLLKADDNAEYKRKGMLYEKVKSRDDLSAVEKWARSTGSYFAVTADAYSQRGVAVGIDTLNKFNSDRITISGKGIVGYYRDSQYKPFRYGTNLNASFRFGKNTKINLELPFYSDPDVQTDYFNRNTVFNLDSAFGNTQLFPTTYSSSLSTYTMKLDASSSVDVGNFRFSMDSLNSEIKMRWNSEDKKYKVETAKLPGVKLSSNGTFLNYNGNDTVLSDDYTDLNASNFLKELNLLKNGGIEYTDDTSGTNMKKPATSLLAGPNASTEKKTRSAGAFKIGYTFSQTADNSFLEEFTPENFNTKISGTVDFSGKVPNKWFSFSDSIKPSLDYEKNKIQGSSDVDMKLENTLSASIPKLGLTYNLSQKVYSISSSENEITSGLGRWNSTDVTAHNLSITQTFGAFSFSFAETFKPLAESLKPAIGVSKNGFTLNTDLNVKRDIGEESFMLDKATANFAYTSKNSILVVKMNNTYDFGTKSWSGYQMYQDAYLYLFQKKLTIYDKMNMTDKFKLSDMVMGIKYMTKHNDENSASLSFKNEKWELDKLQVNLGYTILPKYWWKNRLGLESTLSSDFSYDFSNRYAATLGFKFTMNFAVSKFLSFAFSVKSANNSFYKYYIDDKFSFKELFADLLRSFDFFGSGRSQTGFNLNSLSLSFVHYMHDWNFYCDASAYVGTSDGKSVWIPEIKMYVKWNAIPDIKVENQSKNGVWTNQ